MRTGGVSGGGYWSQRAGGVGGRVQKRGWVIGGARVGWGCPGRGCSSNLGGPMGESGAVGLFPNTREGVWIIGCASPVMSLMYMLNYKDKLFDN